MTISRFHFSLIFLISPLIILPFNAYYMTIQESSLFLFCAIFLIFSLLLKSKNLQRNLPFALFIAYFFMFFHATKFSITLPFSDGLLALKLAPLLLASAFFFSLNPFIHYQLFKSRLEFYAIYGGTFYIISVLASIGIMLNPVYQYDVKPMFNLAVILIEALVILQLLSKIVQNTSKIKYLITAMSAIALLVGVLGIL